MTKTKKTYNANLTLTVEVEENLLLLDGAIVTHSYIVDC